MYCTSSVLARLLNASVAVTVARNCCLSVMYVTARCSVTSPFADILKYVLSTLGSSHTALYVTSSTWNDFALTDSTLKQE